MATFPHDYKTPLPSCRILIDDQWYDCTSWRHKHPGGAELIDDFHNKDATDVFYAFHSKEAIDGLRNIKCSQADAADPVLAAVPQVNKDFRALRQQLERDGYFNRIWAIDAAYVLGTVFMYFLGGYLSYSHPLIATIIMGLAMEQCGWIGHDYGHGRGKVSKVLNYFCGCVLNGFSTEWWSHKHNTHHAFPNRIDMDVDIALQPILWLWAPKKSEDTPNRKFQHLYYLIAYSTLYASWRFQSIQFVLGSGNWLERVLIAIGYMYLATVNPIVSVGSIFFGGFLVAIIVTCNHQPEPMLQKNDRYDFVVDQFVTTRGVVCPDYLSGFTFGGMQYQLEHHIFPFMPKYYYPKMRPIVERFAKEHDLPFKLAGVAEIMVMNYHKMRDCALAPAINL